MHFLLRSLLMRFGLGFDSNEQEQAEQYQNRMFPLGEEEKRLVSRHLQRVISSYPVSKSMFLFLVIREEYLKAEQEGCAPSECAERARKQSLKQHVLPKEKIPYIFSFAILELHISSLEEIPDTDSVLPLQTRLFPCGIEMPDWSALPERNQNNGENEKELQSGR